VRPFVLGLTGSIGMGKTTTAAMLREAGCAVWDADAAVHRLYAPGGAAVPLVAALAPQAVTGGAVNRGALRAALEADPALWPRLEAAVHPLAAGDRARFLAQTQAEVAVLDVPLLYETGLDRACDGVAVVSAPEEVQRARLLARGLDDATIAALLARQMPDAAKRARADWVIPTQTLEGARAAVRGMLDDIARRRREA
jgi:dephospho-CoA kinase